MRILELAVAVLAAGCASWRWSGAGTSPERPPLRASTPGGDVLHPVPPPATPGPEIEEPRAARKEPRPPAAALPPSTEAQRQTALFYSDLGPEDIDVSSYPLQQRYNYRIYQDVCSRCHGLSRSLWAPTATRSWWEFYVLGMRWRGRWQGRPLSRDEVKAVLDFLEHDGRARKLGRAKEFEAQTAELRTRFDAALDERMKRLQSGSPALGR